MLIICTGNVYDETAFEICVETVAEMCVLKLYVEMCVCVSVATVTGMCVLNLYPKMCVLKITVAHLKYTLL